MHAWVLSTAAIPINIRVTHSATRSTDENAIQKDLAQLETVRREIYQGQNQLEG